jgi:uracil DNA glycosylase
MNVNLKYTQPKLFYGQEIQTKTHSIECSDTETFDNGHPKPVGDHAGFCLVFERMDEHGKVTFGDGSKYELVDVS